jgi:hypothetical protein
MNNKLYVYLVFFCYSVVNTMAMLRHIFWYTYLEGIVVGIVFWFFFHRISKNKSTCVYWSIALLFPWIFMWGFYFIYFYIIKYKCYAPEMAGDLMYASIFPVCQNLVMLLTFCVVEGIKFIYNSLKSR